MRPPPLSVIPTSPSPLSPSLCLSPSRFNPKAADYGLVADVFKALPELESALEAAGVKKASS